MYIVGLRVTLTKVLCTAISFSVILISNQNLNAGNLMHWKKKIPLIAKEVCLTVTKTTAGAH